MSAPAVPPRGPVRPSLVTLAAIADLVFGIWALFSAVVTMFLPAIMSLSQRVLGSLPHPRGAADPALTFQVISGIYAQTWVRAWLITAGSLHFFAGIGLLAAGVGLWRMDRWARMTGLLASALYGTVGVAGVIVGFVINVQLSAALRAAGVPNPAGSLSGVVGALFGLAILSLAPLANFLTLLRADTRAAFDAPERAQLARTFE